MRRDAVLHQPPPDRRLVSRGFQLAPVRNCIADMQRRLQVSHSGDDVSDAFLRSLPDFFAITKHGEIAKVRNITGEQYAAGTSDGISFGILCETCPFARGNVDSHNG